MVFVVRSLRYIFPRERAPMPTDSLIVVAAGLVLTGSTGCATRGYVTRTVDERTREVEQRVIQVERVA